MVQYNKEKLMGKVAVKCTIDQAKELVLSDLLPNNLPEMTKGVIEWLDSLQIGTICFITISYGPLQFIANKELAIEWGLSLVDYSDILLSSTDTQSNNKQPMCQYLIKFTWHFDNAPGMLKSCERWYDGVTALEAMKLAEKSFPNVNITSCLVDGRSV